MASPYNAELVSWRSDSLQIPIPIQITESEINQLYKGKIAADTGSGFYALLCVLAPG
jgi:hypothetical protein